MTTTTTISGVAAAVAADAWLRRFRAALVALLGAAVAGIGALAFYTSFEAITAYARRSGGIAPQHAWAVPLLVDSFIVVATGADLWFATTNRDRRGWAAWWPKALLAGAAGVSFVLNVAHVQAGNWAARGVAAIPPAALVLGVELLMLVLRRATTIRTERLTAPVPPDQAAGHGTLAVTLERNAPALPARRNLKPRGGRNPKRGTHAAEPSRYGQAVAWVRGERAAGRRPNGTAVAAKFGISSGLGRRAIRETDQDQGDTYAKPAEPTPPDVAEPTSPTSPTSPPAPSLEEVSP
jgi:hypothetical protein